MATCAATQAAVSTVPSTCDEMVRLRDEAKQLQEKLRESRQRAREHEKEERRSGLRANHSNDYELFLQRKLLKNSLAIAQHIALHRCEELGRES